MPYVMFSVTFALSSELVIKLTVHYVRNIDLCSSSQNTDTEILVKIEIEFISVTRSEIALEIYCDPLFSTSSRRLYLSQGYLSSECVF